MRGSSEIPSDQNSFDPQANAAMATALEQVCVALRINGNVTAREVIAARIIELARRGERDPKKLRDRVLMEAGGSGL
jgi:tartrate dehydratase beta subunit/fumarate hydratase class I family protein